MTTTNYLEMPLSAVLGRFASGDATPGGGSASALAGALAASLAQMVGALTLGKKGYEEAQSETEMLSRDAAELQDTLQGAIAEDAESFEAVMQAMGLPKATDEEKAARKEAMQEALKQATVAPIGVAGACLEVGQLGLRLLAVGNRNASTDAAVCVLLACAGAEGALLNAAINLASIKDDPWVEEHQEASDIIWESLEALRSDLWPLLKATGLNVPGPNVKPGS